MSSDGLEVVAIVTPELHHFEPTMAAIKAKKHIIIEKPIAHLLKKLIK